MYKSESSLFSLTMLNCPGIPQANNPKWECFENEIKYKVKKNKQESEKVGHLEHLRYVLKSCELAHSNFIMYIMYI